MAAQTQDSSGSNHEAGESAGTPVSSYIGLAIIAALVLAMILLQAFGASDLDVAG